jgi:anti-anti-sigma factor
MQNISIIELRGRIDNSTSAEIEAKINAALDTTPKGLILDMAAVDFVSSLGLRVMLSTAKRCRKQNTKIALQAVIPQVAEVFQLSGLAAFFPMHPNREAATAAVA